MAPRRRKRRVRPDGRLTRGHGAPAGSVRQASEAPAGPDPTERAATAGVRAAMTGAMTGAEATEPVLLRLRLAQGGLWRARLPGRGKSGEWARSVRSQTRT